MNTEYPVVSITDVLEARSATHPERIAYGYLNNGEHLSETLTYAALEQRVHVIASQVATRTQRGQRVALVFIPGLEFLAAFLGCLRAGCVAVPLAPPRREADLVRLATIANDAACVMTLTQKALYEHRTYGLMHNAPFDTMPCLCVEAMPADCSVTSLPAAADSPDDLAYLQYTSGSTSTPKGAMITHGNLLANCASMAQHTRLTPESIGVTWLPHFHDMGLVTGYILPLYSGFRGYIMPPAAFVQKPIRWLKAMSDYRGTFTVAPNFAYDLCVRTISEQERASLSLDSWATAINGAEPIRADTLRRFEEVFRPCGYSARASMGGYGLAEATLMVAGCEQSEGSRVCGFQPESLRRGRALDALDGEAVQYLVSCGHAVPDTRVAIVDPDSRQACSERTVGEIWVTGKAVSKGYFGRDRDNPETFSARVEGENGDDSYLRTGDLGFLRDGELYIAGRIKDVIILRGRNHYPQDIEQTACEAHASLSPTAAAAFSIEHAGREALVVMAELHRRAARNVDGPGIAAAIRKAVRVMHDVHVEQVVLIRPSSLLRTSSGKVQRQRCRSAFLERSLSEVFRDAHAVSSEPAASHVKARFPASHDVERWILEWVARRTGAEPSTLEPDGTFLELGLDSVGAVAMTGELSGHVGLSLRETVAWDHPTPTALAAHVTELLSGAKSLPLPAAARASLQSNAALDHQPTAGEAERVALVGLSCRFPGAAGAEALWRVLSAGECTVSQPTTVRTKDPSQATGWGGFLPDVAAFDAEYFGISGREALAMDPQQRWLLELVSEALEDAGLVLGDALRKRTGVFVGLSTHDYLTVAQRQGVDTTHDLYATTGTAHSIAAGRISYQLGLRGPSLVVDTACSSSLVALHLAVQSLQRGECDVAIVAAANAILLPDIGRAFERSGMLARDGRCKTFDTAADGYVRSEGCAAVILRRLSDAQSAGDRVRAVVRGSAINHDGDSNGLTAPSRAAQREVIAQALKVAGVSAGDVSYLEAHGTGTPLGDPIEVAAINDVFAAAARADACVLGSIKTNLGHLEAAAGLAGLIKVVLAFEARKLPPHLHFGTANPRLDLSAVPLRIVTELEEWPDHGRPRLAGVSSFGISGSNAHVLLEEAPPLAHSPTVSSLSSLPVLLLSAATPRALAKQAGAWSTFVATLSDAELKVAGVHSALCRRALPQRLAIVASQPSDYAAALEAYLQGAQHPSLHVSKGARASRIAFVFPGQGGQWAGMARELYAREPIFRSALDRVDRAIQTVAGFSVIELLLAPPPPEEFARAALVQPATFAVQVGLCALLESWGIKPAAVVGHSMGEVAAAYIAGALTIEDAARVVCERSRLVARVEGRGLMAMIDLPAAALEPIVARTGGAVAVAAENGPRTTLIAGDAQAVRAIVLELEAQSVFCRLVEVQYASHSPHMLELVPALEQALAGIAPQPSNVEMFSTVSGRALGDELLDVGYWVRNLCERVQLAGAVREALRGGCDLLLEIGPHPVLKPALRQLAAESGSICPVVSTLVRDQSDRDALSCTLAALHIHGCSVDWRRVYGNDKPAWRGALPRYVWDHVAHWWPKRSAHAATEPSEGQAWQLRPCALRAGALQRDVVLGCQRTPRLAHHRVEEVALLSAADQIELMIESASRATGAPIALRDIAFVHPVPVPEQGSCDLQLVFEHCPAGSGRLATVTCFTFADSNSEALAVSRAQVDSSVIERPAAAAEPAALGAIAARCGRELSAESLYSMLAKSGLDYGPTYRTVLDVRIGADEALARVQSSPRGEAFAPMLDGCCHVVRALLADCSGSDRAFVPSSAARVELDCERLHEVAYSHATLAECGVDSARVSIRLLDAQGRLVGSVTDMIVRALSASHRPASEVAGDSWLHALRWMQTERLPPAAVTSGNVLLLGRADGLSAPLSAALAALGANVRHLVCERGDAQDLLLEELHTGRQIDAVVLAAGADEPELFVATVDDLLDRQRRLALELQASLQAVVNARARRKPKLWCLTRGVVSVTDEALLSRPTAALLWGLARSLRFEHPDLVFGCVDLSAIPDAAELAALALELTANQAEIELALRGQSRFVARLGVHKQRGATSQRLSPARGRAYRLEAAHSGQLDALTLREAARAPLAAREVEVAVDAAGMNFRDVLIALNSLEAHDPTLGFEFVGRVSRIGEEVDDLALGERVLGIAPGSFGAYAVADRRLLVPCPAELTTLQAATLPVAQLSAYYSLAHVAQLKRGERLLVHAASGGVGLAALQWARHVGAEVIATAGSERKRDYLRELGVTHVFDSRSLAFADGVREVTDGAGVDVVLNSLSGPLLTASLDLLRSHGRFVELGRRDYEADVRVGLRPFLRGLSLAFVDVRALCSERPALIARLLGEVMAHVEQGVLAPLPSEAFPMSKARDAFFHMARANHIGKVVLTAEPEPLIESAVNAPLLDPSASYLITGGLGGLGLGLAQHLAGRGATQLVLVSRNAPGPDVQRVLDALANDGVDVHVVAADVSDRAELERLFARFGGELRPLKGVFHAAGALADGMFLTSSEEAISTVLNAKAVGAWQLAQLCEALPLDYFVLFSSAAGLLGSPGQAAYAGANTFLDALAASRRSRGLAALSIDWGTFAHVGLAAQRSNRGARLGQRGIGSLELAEGLAVLDRLLATNPPAHLGVLKLNVRQLLEFYPAAASSPTLSELVESARSPGHDAAASRNLLEQLRKLPRQEQQGQLEALVWSELCAVLRLHAAAPRPDTPFKELGLDSLMSLELRNRLEEALGLQLSAATIWRYPTLRKLAGGLARSLGLDVNYEPAAVLASEPLSPSLSDALLTDEQALREIERVAQVEEGEG
jgi:acyl transferase domain-containing protein/acyl-CoA synthetase (AMP-forming)/AMP-acid ligase II/acyl carrier protein